MQFNVQILYFLSLYIEIEQKKNYKKFLDIEMSIYFIEIIYNLHQNIHGGTVIVSRLRFSLLLA